MPAATLSTRGHITIPADIRRAMAVKSKDRISFTAMPSGTVVLRAKTKTMLDIKGILEPRPGTTVSIEEMSFGPSKV